MPELPETERAAKLLRAIAAGKKITRVETTEDTIVYSGTTHTEFATEITGRTVKTAGRHGKVFYLELEGEGKMPVLHFGMTGMLQVKGELPTYYRKKGKDTAEDWPPRFMKFILHLSSGNAGEEDVAVAFMDARRLGRIRLCANPTQEPPISELGFDPILSMPDLSEFSQLVLKRSCPIKALLLDQSFSAGVGNWVADEILYHSRVHPEQRCNTLTEDQLHALHYHTSNVCKVAIAVDADDAKFPDDWLFKHRWGKGKKDKHTMTLATGEPATIKWLTVGGRTSAFVCELQKLPAGDEANSKKPRRSAKVTVQEGNNGSESDLTPMSDEDEDEAKPRTSTAKRKAARPRKTAGKKRKAGESDVSGARVDHTEPLKLYWHVRHRYAMAVRVWNISHH